MGRQVQQSPVIVAVPRIRAIALPVVDAYLRFYKTGVHDSKVRPSPPRCNLVRGFDERISSSQCVFQQRVT